MWKVSIVMNDFITPFFLAVIWATLGCTIIRLFWQSTYDRICAFWLLTVFSFTFFNRIVVLTHFAWPTNIIVSSLAVFGPVISHFKYRFDSSIEEEAETLHQLLYGLFLLVSSVVLTFVTKKIIEGLWIR